MRKQIQPLIVWAIVFLSAVGIPGQAKQIEKKAYQERVIKALDDLREKSYRSTTVSEKLNDRDSKPVHVSKRIFEVIPPDKTRWIIEVDEEKREIVQIGQRRFVKSNSGNWKGDNEKRLVNKTIGSEQIESESYTIDENAELNGQKVILYEKSEKFKVVGDGAKDRRENLTTRFWLTRDGVLLRTQSELENVDSKGFLRTTTDYEYDPKGLKIEAPVK